MVADAFQHDWDPRLTDLMAADDARAAERIASFAVRNIEPAVRAATTAHLSALPAADRADVAASCRDRLLGFLRAVHRGDRTVPVADLDAFAATCADGACRDYLRRTRPFRARLTNRLRLLCTRGTGAVMWRTSDGVLVAGLPAWTQRDPLEHPFPWRDQPKAWWGNAHAAAEGSALVPTVLRILQKAGAPVAIDAITDLLLALTGIEDLTQRLDASPEGDEPELAILIPSATADHLHVARKYLEEAWRLCLEMPRYMRTAVLLSLRDQFGAGLLPVFHAAGVTPLRQVSDALGMKPDELAAIWAHLPWDDRAIGRRLGITGLQVLNLRTAARSRLLRGMALKDER
ncbi:MAG: hypothetical protein AB7H93_23710 [Vicinamibacterales bacterium]